MLASRQRLWIDKSQKSGTDKTGLHVDGVTAVADGFSPVLHYGCNLRCADSPTLFTDVPQMARVNSRARGNCELAF